ncbi:hypothetical protein EVAR_23857_1 [Eumeta japonica]|uniref:Uncharacterized protein n=1 Tax=Eumeta variegata TaxID=151549 RepID=A0A4C1V605_EUMVA|nr:hypothetical protein EVAR_23857_1 [Eumeta japonica]
MSFFIWARGARRRASLRRPDKTRPLTNTVTNAMMKSGIGGPTCPTRHERSPLTRYLAARVPAAPLPFTITGGRYRRPRGRDPPARPDPRRRDPFN